jgi:glucosylceramidase
MSMRHLLFFLSLTLIQPVFGQKVRIITSTKDGNKKMAVEEKRFDQIAGPNIASIKLDPQAIYQTIFGFGDTYSEATSRTLQKLSKEKRQEVLQALFDPKKGAGWNFCRTTINSCDASSEYYAYLNVPGDTALQAFSIQKDLDNYMIPGLRQAQIYAKGKLRLFASPWTPPIWMKNSGAHNFGSLRYANYAAWAKYFSKYLSAYAANGVKIWGVTPQNEPEAYHQAWDACGWTPDSLRMFVSDYLGPRLEREHPQVKIGAWDHNKNHLMLWANTFLQDPKTAQYIDFLAHHWYDGGEGKMYEPLQEAHAKYPNYPLMATEQGVFGLFVNDGTPAELYARDLIENMNNWSTAWVAWGMAWETNGGPNHAKNFNHAPIMIDLATETINYNPSYYYIAQFSKYVQVGAKRIGFKNPHSGLLMTAFLNPDDSMVIAVLNETDQSVATQLTHQGKNLPLSLEAHSLVTLVWR